MTLDLRAEAWAERMEHTDEDLLEVLDGIRNDVRKYVGPYFRQPGEGRQPTGDPHNTAWNFITQWLPRLVFGTPQADISTTRIGEEREDALALEFAINRWSRQVNLRELNEQVGVDFAFRFGVVLTRFEPQEGFSEFEDPPMWPSPSRVAPEDFLYDAQQKDRKRWRYVGHKYRRDLADIIEEAEGDEHLGWNLDVLKNIPEDGLVDDTGLKSSRMYYENRKELELREIWVPEVRVDDLKDLGVPHPDKDADGNPYTSRYGYNGCWITLGAWQAIVGGGEERDRWVRWPRMAWNRRKGPFTFFGGYFVPEEAMPLSPIIGTKAQAVHLNKVARARQEAVERFKRIALVSADDPILQDVIVKARNGEVIPVESVEELSKRFAELSIGGDPDGALLAGEAAAMQIWQMATGMTESQRGEVTGVGTATENEIARNATDARVGMLSMKFTGGVQDVMDCAAWFLWKSHKSPMRLPNGGFYMGGENRGDAVAFAQKYFKDEKVGLPPGIPLRQIPKKVVDRWRTMDRAAMEDRAEDLYDALDLTIQPYSMERTNDGVQQMRLQSMMQLVAQLFPMIPQMPWVRWAEFLQMIAQFGNVPELPAIANMEVAGKFSQMMVAQMGVDLQQGGKGGGQGQQGGAYKQPRLANDQGPYTGGEMSFGRGGRQPSMLAGHQSGAQSAAATRRNGQS